MVVSGNQLPAAFLQRMKLQLGHSYNDFLAALESEPPISIRLNPLKPAQVNGLSQRVPWCPHGYYLQARPSFTHDPLFHAGAYYVQEASSMFLDHVLSTLPNIEADLRVLDLSAAPGGKTTLLQSRLTDNSLLLANEVIGHRNSALRQNLIRWGGANCIVTQSDPRFFLKLRQYFDIILVDAPCSGEGLFRRQPQAASAWSENRVASCSQRQRRILADVVPALAPGGILIYSTCTYSVEENEENMRWIQSETDLRPFDVDIPEEWHIQKGYLGYPGFRFYPHNEKGEGFFMAVLQRPEKRHGRMRQGQPKSKLALLDSNWAGWLKDAQRYAAISVNGVDSALPRSLFEDFTHISHTLRVKLAGIPLGKRHGRDVSPAPELALNTALASTTPVIELSRKDAVRYLSHRPIQLDESVMTGYALVSFKGFGLGWINVLKGHQYRNKYPLNWRILKQSDSL